jgi:hypothetical protein
MLSAATIPTKSATNLDGAAIFVIPASESRRPDRPEELVVDLLTLDTGNHTRRTVSSRSTPLPTRVAAIAEPGATIESSLIGRGEPLIGHSLAPYH